MRNALHLVSFEVRDPVPINRAYGIGGGNFYMRKPAKEFKDRVHAQALAARPRGWPKFAIIKRAILAYQLYDCKMDTDGPRKILKDALEGVFYEDDRICEDGPAPLPIKDGKGRRVMVLLAVTEIA